MLASLSTEECTPSYSYEFTRKPSWVTMYITNHTCSFRFRDSVSSNHYWFFSRGSFWFSSILKWVACFLSEGHPGWQCRDYQCLLWTLHNRGFHTTRPSQIQNCVFIMGASAANYFSRDGWWTSCLSSISWFTNNPVTLSFWTRMDLAGILLRVLFTIVPIIVTRRILFGFPRTDECSGSWCKSDNWYLH